MSGLGYQTRTTIAVSVWLAFGIYFLAEASRPLPSFSVFGLRSARLVAVPLLLTLGFSYYRVQVLWITATDKLDQALKSAPITRLAALPAGSSLVYLGPTAIKGFLYLGNVEMGVGLAAYHRELTAPGKFLAPLSPTDRRSVTWTGRVWALVPNSQFHWDGQRLSHSLPGHWKFSSPVERLFIWTADGDVREVQPGWTEDPTKLVIWN
jgi:hypothetical protein